MSRPDRVPWPYLILFLLVYAVQGVVFAYFMNFNLTYMTAGGVPPRAAGDVQSLALLPFVFKFLAGPISDRYNVLGYGHRKPYIVAGLAVQAAGLLGLSATDPGAHLGAFGLLAVLTVAGLALYDTCTDGLIVTLTPPGDRARVQGLAMGARFLTATAFALGFGFWLERTGIGPGRGHRVLWACAALTLAPLVLALALREPPRDPEAEWFDWSGLRVMVRPRSLLLLAFGTFYSLVAYGVEISLPSYYQRMDFTQGQIGLSSAARSLGRAAGSLLLPVGSSWLGRRWTLRIAILGLMATQAGQAAVGGSRGAAGLGFALGAANGWTDALYYVLAMEASDPRLAASTYALFMAVSNLSVTGGSAFGRLVDAFGGDYRPAFVAASLLTALALPLVRPLARPSTAAAADDLRPPPRPGPTEPPHATVG